MLEPSRGSSDCRTIKERVTPWVVAVSETKRGGRKLKQGKDFPFDFSDLGILI
jgi:hypothetical protein